MIYDDNTKKVYEFESTIEENKNINIYETINNKKTNINNKYKVRNNFLLFIKEGGTFYIFSNCY